MREKYDCKYVFVVCITGFNAINECANLVKTAGLKPFITKTSKFAHIYLLIMARNVPMLF
jgi:hypothetical protein